MSDHELCHSPSKPIGDEKTHSNLLWHSTSHHVGLFLEWWSGVKLWSLQQSLLYNDTSVTRTHDIGFDTICRTVSYAIPLQKQLVMRRHTQIYGIRHHTM